MVAPSARTTTLSGAPRHPRGRKGLICTAMFERYTERAIKAVLLGQEEAKACSAQETGTAHLLLGLITEEAGRGMDAFKLDPDASKAAVRSLTYPRRSLSSASYLEGMMNFTPNAKLALEASLREAGAMGHKFISPEHLFCALLSLPPDASARKVIAQLGGDCRSLKEAAIRRLKGEQQAGGEAMAKPAQPARKRRKPADISKFTRNLVEAAASGNIDPVFGRDQDVLRVCQILGRRSKNNPVLLGEPGVGKTAVAEGLALAIVSGRVGGGMPVPDFVLGVKLLQLDVTLMMAGTKDRGEVEQRVADLLEFCAADPNVVLVIDEIHTIVGAGRVRGSGGGGLDVANLIKPALARGGLRVIGATTLDEHRKHIEPDAALERRLQPVTLDEPTQAEATQILLGLRERYEAFHGCVYSDAAVEAAVSLSARYIADRHLPDKAIDLLDEAGSRARIARCTAQRRRDVVPLPTWGVYGELAEVTAAKDTAVRESLFEEATLLLEREGELRGRLEGEPAGAPPLRPQVGVPDIEAIVAAWSGVPVETLSAESAASLVDLEGRLAGGVIGQREAVAAAARAMRRAGAGLKAPGRPIASMLFAGPTGVGKTHLAKSIAAACFGSEEALVRLDMSECMERHSVSKLVGAPPGYAGYGEQAGYLTEQVRRRPYSIVLLDEIEKAHPDVFNLLLQIIEDGRLTDSTGRTVSFKHCLIVATSNVGSNVINKGGGGLGFDVSAESGADRTYSHIRGLVLEEMKQYFRPELLNRLDEVVVFRPLERASVAVIAELMLQDTRELLAAKELQLDVSPAVMELIMAQGGETEYGARPLRRTITALLEDPLCDAMLSGELQAGDTVRVELSATDGAVVVVPVRGGVRAHSDMPAAATA